MDIFNAIAGIVTVVSAVFAVYVYVMSRKREAVETQKARDYQQRLADLLSMVNAVAQQGTLVAAMADRDEVTKKELKHLTIAQLATIQSVQDSLVRIHAREEAWSFGVPSAYIRIQSHREANAVSPNEP